MAADGSFDDPNLDEIPEDDFYTNTDLSLPSLRLDPIVDSPLDASPSHAAHSFDQRTDEDVSVGSKDLTEDDLSLPPIDIAEVAQYDSVQPPLVLIESSPVTTTSLEDTVDALIPTIADIQIEDSFDDFGNFSDKDVNSNQMNQDDTECPDGSDVPANEFCLKTIPVNNQTDIDIDAIEFGTNEFAVDFSQFNSFESKPIELQNGGDSPNPYPEDELNLDDDDDDFGDFNDAPPPEFSATFPTTANVEDDFGDFSNFQNNQPSIPIVQTDLKAVCAQADQLLTMMFPSDQSVTIEHAQVLTKDADLLNNITLAVRNVDDSKALQHQWVTSTGKNSLVRALGIDARNIVRLNSRTNYCQSRLFLQSSFSCTAVNGTAQCHDTRPTLASRRSNR